MNTEENHESYIENAIDWALDHVGSTDYPLLCLAFVEDAYERANHIEVFGGDSAAESAEQYGTVEEPALPPRGTLVFYDCYGTIEGEYRNWGHVGISLGDGNVVHSWKEVRVDPFMDIEKLKPAEGWTPPRYIGWTSVEHFLEGHRKRDW